MSIPWQLSVQSVMSCQGSLLEFVDQRPRRHPHFQCEVWGGVGKTSLTSFFLKGATVTATALHCTYRCRYEYRYRWTVVLD